MATTRLTLEPLIGQGDDFDALVSLFDAYRGFYGYLSDGVKARRFLAARLAVQQSLVWLARVEQHPAGFVQVYPGWSSLACAPIDRLNDLYVEPTARGSGVGAALIQTALASARARRVAAVVLETGVENHGAQALYKRLGFVQDDGFLTFSYSLGPTEGVL